MNEKNIKDETKLKLLKYRLHVLNFDEKDNLELCRKIQKEINELKKRLSK